MWGNLNKITRFKISKIENLLKESSTNRLRKTRTCLEKEDEPLKIELIVVTRLIIIRILTGIIRKRLNRNRYTEIKNKK